MSEPKRLSPAEAREAVRRLLAREHSWADVGAPDGLARRPAAAGGVRRAPAAGAGEEAEVMMSDTEHRFRAGICAHPSDWQTMLVFADWLHEHERLAEEFLFRWLARWKRHPHEREHYTLKDGWNRAVSPRYRFGWYHDGVVTHKLDPHPRPVACLPRLVFTALGAKSWDHAYYDGFWAALADLERALFRLRAVLVID